jgi:hypothetical protein
MRGLKRTFGQTIAFAANASDIFRKFEQSGFNSILNHRSADAVASCRIDCLDPRAAPRCEARKATERSPCQRNAAPTFVADATQSGRRRMIGAGPGLRLRVRLSGL